MKKKGIFTQRWTRAFTIFAVLAWLSSPLISYFTAEANNPPNPAQLKLEAALTGSPINNVSPFGLAEYKLESNGLRKFELEVFSVALAAGTNLDVYINNTFIGQVGINSSQTGELEMRSDRNQTLPAIQSGDVISIRLGSTTIISGTFVNSGSPSPTASPTGSPTACLDGPIFADLTGATINGEIPRGFAQYRNRNNNQLKVFVRFVNLAGGTTLDVYAGSTLYGQIVLRDNGNGQVFIDTNTTSIVPGTVLTIRNGSTTILSGTFFCVNPAPSPSPSVSPTASPTTSPTASPTASPTVSPTASPTVSPTVTPSPTPTHPHFHHTLMTGNHVVPAVNTQAHGTVEIYVNDAQTHIQVSANFFNLTSNQTGTSIHCPALPGQNTAATFNLGAIGGTSGYHPHHIFPVTREHLAQLRAGLCYAQVSSVNHPNGEIRGQFHSSSISGDFEGDGMTDLSVYRPSEGNWYILSSDDNSFRAHRFGLAGDKPLAGDYDGDGKGDLAVFRGSGGFGYWYIHHSSDGTVAVRQWGLSGDIPVEADYNGDGRTDLTVYRPSEGNWYVSINNSYIVVRWGIAEDIPVAGDFDADGRHDFAVFRPSTGVWYVNRSRDGNFVAIQWGMRGDIPQAKDFDGDGRTDMAVFRPSDGNWYIRRSIDGDYRIVRFGLNGDVPVAGRFDRDRKADIAVFRPSDGNWYILRTDLNDLAIIKFGQSGDVPVISD